MLWKWIRISSDDKVLASKFLTDFFVNNSTFQNASVQLLLDANNLVGHINKNYVTKI